MRRSQLASWVIVTLMIVTALIALVGISDPITLVAVAVGMIGFVFAAYLNRQGHVFTTGVFLVVLLCAAIMGAIATQPQGLLLQTDGREQGDMITRYFGDIG